jgi:hypothetical protein
MLANTRGNNSIIKHVTFFKKFPHALDCYLRNDRIFASFTTEWLGCTPVFNLLDPFLMACGKRRCTLGAGIDHANKILQRQTDITMNWQISLLDFVKLRWIDIHMHNFAMLGEFTYFARNTVIKANTKGEKKIGFVNGIIAVHGAMHAKHVKAEEMLRREATKSKESHGNRNTSFLSKGFKMLGGVAADNPTACIDDGFFAGTQHFEKFFEFFTSSSAIGCIARQVHRGIVVCNNFAHLHIFRHINNNGARPT